MYQLPPVDNDKTFEELVRDICRHIFNEPLFELYGRRGQKQDGIDGYHTINKKVIAFQCKQKTIFGVKSEQLVETLKSEMQTEAQKAKIFFEKKGFPVEKYIFATTYKKDVHLQNHATSLSRELDFPIEYLSWDTITDYIRSNKEIFKQYYPLFFENYTESSLLKSQESHVEKIEYALEEYYLSRYVCLAKDYDIGLLYFKDKYSKDLADVVLKNNFIVLLGDAGIGKSIELKRVAAYYYRKDNSLFPFVANLNKYVNQSIDDLLPESLSKVQENRRLIILDGLDEIASENKSNAIRQIELFTEKYSECHILISCRTNFFVSESEKYSGTLKGFSQYRLLELDNNNIQKYINEKLNHKAERFNDSVYTNRLYDLLKIPFYLVRLVDLFKKNNSLPNTKSGIFKQLLDYRIQHDTEHYRTTIDLIRKKSECFNVLKKLALGMEIFGRNYVTNDEYERLVEDENQRTLIEFGTVWKKEESKNTTWQFEHNNFQEYLAAEVLSKKSVQEIKETIFFGPDYKKLIPSWSNTLSFLIDISDNQELIAWVLDNEPELVVKFERDRVKEDTRIEIFKKIFNYYKERKIWIDHEKFSFDQLARFGQSKEVVEFLLDEVKDEIHYTTRANIIMLLAELDIPNELKSHVCDLLVDSAINQIYGTQTHSRALMALSDLKMSSCEVVSSITKELRDSKDDWIRYSLYYFLHNSSCLDKNIDIFLEGLKYTRFKISSNENRLMNESIELRRGLEKAKSSDALLTIINHFISKPKDLQDITLEKSIHIIAENAADAYIETPDLFGAVKKLFHVLVENHANKQAEELVVFFERTETKLILFKEYFSQSGDSVDKWHALSILADENYISFIVEQYKENKLCHDDLNYYRNIFSYKNHDLYLKYKDAILKETGKDISFAPQQDFEEVRKERLQRDIDLLFDRQLFLDEIKLVFETENKETLTKEDIRDIQISHWNNPYFSDAIINHLREWTEENGISYEEIEKFVKNWKWDWFCVGNVYERFNRSEMINLSEQQRVFIKEWCYSNIKKVKFKTALTISSNDKFSADRLAIFLWFFLRKLNLTYPKTILLDLLSFDWLEGNGWLGIDYLEELVEENEITSRILSNLTKGISQDVILKNHINYCKRHNIDSAFPYAINVIINSNHGNEVRKTALDMICSLRKKGQEELEKLLPSIQDEFIWEIIERLILKDSKICHDYLLSQMNTVGNEDEQLKYATYLVEMNDLEGLNFYVNWIEKYDKIPETSLRDKLSFRKLSSKNAIPYLIKLLRISYKPSFRKQKSVHLEHYVQETLSSIALLSDDNYKCVKEAITEFIEENIDKISDINFLYIFIERIERQYYISKISSISLDEAILKMKQLC